MLNLHSKECHYPTIIISYEAWSFLKNEQRKHFGLTLLTEEQLQKSWNRMKYRNQGASQITHPISEKEIRIYKDSTCFKLELIKQMLNDNGFSFRDDGFILDCIEL